MVPNKIPSIMRTLIPLRLSLDSASQLCKFLLNGSLADFTSQVDLQGMAILSGNKASPHAIWLPYKRVTSGHIFKNIYSQELFNASLWSNRQPSMNKNCLVCNVKGCHSEDCNIKQFFFCSIDQWPVVAKLRGLCRDTPLSLAYYPSYKLGSFAWVSIGGTYITFNITSQTWKVAVADNIVSGEILAPYESFLTGKQLWTIRNSLNYYAAKAVEIWVSLATCSDNYFNCDTGECVLMYSKCDGRNECGDGSDELHCKFVQLPDNYNKEISPRYSDESKAQVNISFEVINVLYVNEEIGKMRIKFMLSAAWNDYRLHFLDLWNITSLNTIRQDEMEAIWQPILNFDNAEQELFDYNLKTEISVIWHDSAPFSLSPPSELYKANEYYGAFSSLYQRSVIRFV